MSGVPPGQNQCEGVENRAPAFRGGQTGDVKWDGTVSLVALVMCLIVYWAVVMSIQPQAITQPWITGDWLINYSSGFVRRGLIGEIVRQLYYAAGIPPLSTILALKAILYGLTCLALVLIARRRHFDVFDLALLLCPAALPFELYDPAGSGRKEIAFLAAFTVYVALDTQFPTDRAPVYRRWQFWFLVIVPPVLALVHEGLIFFFPFFLAYSWVKDHITTDARALGIASALVGSVFLLSYVFQGNANTSNIICASVTDMSLDNRLCAGAIEAMRPHNVQIRVEDAAKYLALAGFSFLPLMGYVIQTMDVREARRLFTGLGVSVAATVPLYAVAEDWGRWIHVTWLLMFVITLAFKAASFRLHTRSRALMALYAVSIALYLFSWQIPHWIHSRLPILKWHPYRN